MTGKIKKLYEADILSPRGLYHLAGAARRCGANLTAMLDFAANMYKERVAVADENETITYGQLQLQSLQLAVGLQEQYKLSQGHRVGILCRNHVSFIRSVFAVSQCGVDLYLLNVEMSGSQLNMLLDQHAFDLIIHDPEVGPLIYHSAYRGATLLSSHESMPSVDSLSKLNAGPDKNNAKTSGGRLIVLTGGTTGHFKQAARKPSFVSFLHPFTALLERADLHRHRSVYIGTPVYHGFGIAAVFMSIILGVQIHLRQKFDAGSVRELIAKQKIQAISLVPLMLSRLLSNDHEKLGSLKCILSGGAALDPALVIKTQRKLGHILFNLYGTSEAGFSIMAAPDDLRYAANTAGRPIDGLQLKILDGSDQETKDGSVGRICVKSTWAAHSQNVEWVETGDLGYMDAKGYYFLCGRVDDMVVSGGENVYPAELEHILLHHNDIMHAAVIGIPDEEFGQRLKAFIVRADDSEMSSEDVREWLTGRIARFQMPKYIEFVPALPYTALGKPDKRVLV